MKTIYVEVEDNDNCEYIPMLAYEARDEAVLITRVRLFEPDHPQGVYQITGWSSDGDGRPCPAWYVPVSASGQAVVYLIYGGAWGVRMKPDEDQHDLDIGDLNQWGEPYLMLTDKTDLLIDS